MTDRRWGDLVLWGPFTPITDASLDHVSEVVGHPLPLDYRAFLKAVHGGTLQYSVSVGGVRLEFSELLGPSELIEAWRSHPSTYYASSFPPTVLPIARDGGGSTLFLGLRDQSVLAFVHGFPAWAGGDGQDHGGFVASSWTEYLGMLSIDEDMAQEIWDEADPEWLPSVIAWLDAGLPDWRSRLSTR